MAKSDLFSDTLQQTALAFKVLGHPARLAILNHLAETQTCITGNICDHLPLSRTTVNQHLKELKDLGLIKGTIEGVRVNYCLNNSKIELIKQILEDFTKNLLLSTPSKCKPNETDHI